MNVDDNEFEEMAVTEFDKAKVKSTLKNSIVKKKRKRGWKMNVAAAAVIVGLSTTTVGLAFPAYASNIPIIGDIFRFFDFRETGLYDNYKEYSTQMNLTQESGGIKITINDAIFDGETVAITYSIVSDRDLGEVLTKFPMPTIKDSSGHTGSSHITKIDNYHYVGLDRITPLRITSDSSDVQWGVANSDRVAVKWNIASLFPDTDELIIKGNWKFAFSLPATDSQIQLTNRSVDQHGIVVTIDKITFIPMSFVVHYTQRASEQVLEKWQQPHIELEIKDDLGNKYYGDSNGGYGRPDYTMTWGNTFKKLDPSATKLIITPHASVYDETNSGNQRVEFVLDDIVIELVK
ncbi:DUF4179 domain-containing protein [Sporosarcina beigongshangi]|uniref:DUF4179 domain-containing protein n=1 Tax=Sporosarcina beigongshangi TaxID=2782538 RepID=UPI001939AD76|nr:DUF4179 domain-containing protein [Sporosarcina beigongshangi]